MCVWGGGGSIFARSSRLDPYGHTGVLGSGRFPIIAGPRCRPGVLRPCVAPRPVRYALGPEPGSLPQDHPGSGVVAPWLPPGQLHGNSSCVCVSKGRALGCRHDTSASAQQGDDVPCAHATAPIGVAKVRGEWRDSPPPLPCPLRAAHTPGALPRPHVPWDSGACAKG